MKKQRTPARKTARKGPAASPKHPVQASREDTAQTRRAFLGQVRNGALAAGVLGLGGWSISRTYARQVELADLAAIGNGIPTVVQIHDPQCPTCQELQKRMLKAAKSFDKGVLQVRVANILGPEGRAIADRYSVPHVTLLLFDGEGEMQRVLSGLQEVDHLRDQFGAHVARHSARS